MLTPPEDVRRSIRNPSQISPQLGDIWGIGERHCGFDVVFSPEFTEEIPGECERHRQKRAEAKQKVCFRAGDRIQPVLLVVDPGHGLVGQ